jgi:hypothetical protein
MEAPVDANEAAIRAKAEIAAAVLSGALHLAPLELLFPHIYFIVGVSLAWVVYVGFRVARDRPSAPSTGSGQTGSGQGSQLARWGRVFRGGVPTHPGMCRRSAPWVSVGLAAPG